MKNKIVVIGGNHHNTLGVLRSLGLKGQHPHLILIDDNDINKCFVAKSRYIKDAVCLPDYNDAVDYLVNHFSGTQDNPTIVICTSDGASSIVDLNRDRLGDNFVLPGSEEQGRITSLMNKQTMSELASEVGLQVPKTWLMTDDKIPNGVSFPCIVKPLLSIEGSKGDIKVFNNHDQFTDYLNTKYTGTKLQIQEFIKKDFEYQFIGCSLNKGERVIIPGYSHVIRPSDNSNTGFLQYLPLDNTFDIDNCMEFIKRTGYSGLFSMEFLRDKSGRDYFMEINFRNDGNAICVTAAGVNLPYIWCLYNADEDIESEIHDVKSVYVMPEFDDFILVLKRRVSIGTWIKDIKKSDCFMEYDKHDRKPFYHKMKSFLKMLIKRIV